MTKHQAAPIPRVHRSTRDDRFVAGNGPGSKRAYAGWVVDRDTTAEDPTVTVRVLGEDIPGVLPLGPMPPLGAIVEVESRRDLLVIPYWYEGPPLPPTTIITDVYLTRARIVANPTGTAYDLDYFHDLPADGPIVFHPYPTKGPTYLYPVQYDGQDALPPYTFTPATPSGYVLTDIRPFLVAHTTDGTQSTITVDTSGWGYHPPPTKTPFLTTNHSRVLCFDTFPAEVDPADPIVCGDGIAPLSNEQYQAALVSGLQWPTAVPACQIVVSAYGWRYTFVPIP